MTTHAEDRQPGVTGRLSQFTRSQRRALMIGLVALVAGALVIAGIASLSTVLYVGAFGGMMLMLARQGSRALPLNAAMNGSASRPTAMSAAVAAYVARAADLARVATGPAGVRK